LSNAIQDVSSFRVLNLKNFARYMLMAVLAEVAGLVLIFGMAHFLSHNLSPELSRRLASYDLSFSKHPLSPDEYKTNRVEAERSLAELSNLSATLSNGTGFLLALPIISVLAAFNFDARKKRAIKKVDQIEQPDTELVFSEGTAKWFFFSCLSLPVLLLSGCCVLGKAWTESTTLWIFSQSFSALIYFFPITILFLAGLVFAMRRAPKNFRWRYVLAFLPLVPSMLSVIWGGFWHSVSSTPLFSYDGWQSQILGYMFWLYFPLAVLALYACKGHRLFCMAVVTCEFCLTLSTFFVAVMACSGKWL
jgi:hypothetical protein